MIIDYRTSRKIMLFSSLVYVIVALFFFIEHDDYKLYMVQWESYLHGELDPTYPPTFSMAFATLYAIWYKFPKLVFVLSFVVTTLQLHEHLFKHPDFSWMSERQKFWLIMLFFIISPNCWWHVWTGLFDSLVGLCTFNMYLVLKNKSMAPLVKDTLLLGLIIAIILLKFTGIFLIVPFLFFNTTNQRASETAVEYEARQHAERRKRALILVGGGACIIIPILIFFNIWSFISPFIVHSTRPYETLYEFAGYTNSPFFVKFFVELYSKIGLYVFLCAIGITYIYCYKARVSNEAWLLLPMLVFMTFFQVSHAQFLLWILHVLAMYNVKHDKYNLQSHVRRHLFWVKFIDGVVFFFIPFGQFFYAWVINEIVVKERGERERNEVLVKLPPGVT
jgi:hypothetical protein